MNIHLIARKAVRNLNPPSLHAYDGVSIFQACPICAGRRRCSWQDEVYALLIGMGLFCSVKLWPHPLQWASVPDSTTLPEKRQWRPQKRRID
jgi:hypothetical protein